MKRRSREEEESDSDEEEEEEVEEMSVENSTESTQSIVMIQTSNELSFFNYQNNEILHPHKIDDCETSKFLAFNGNRFLQLYYAESSSIQEEGERTVPFLEFLIRVWEYDVDFSLLSVVEEIPFVWKYSIESNPTIKQVFHLNEVLGIFCVVSRKKGEDEGSEDDDFVTVFRIKNTCKYGFWFSSADVLHQNTFTSVCRCGEYMVVCGLDENAKLKISVVNWNFIEESGLSTKWKSLSVNIPNECTSGKRDIKVLEFNRKNNEILVVEKYDKIDKTILHVVNVKNGSCSRIYSHDRKDFSYKFEDIIISEDGDMVVSCGNSIVILSNFIVQNSSSSKFEKLSMISGGSKKDKYILHAFMGSELLATTRNNEELQIFHIPSKECISITKDISFKMGVIKIHELLNVGLNEIEINKRLEFIRNHCSKELKNIFYLRTEKAVFHLPLVLVLFHSVSNKQYEVSIDENIVNVGELDLYRILFGITIESMSAKCLELFKIAKTLGMFSIIRVLLNKVKKMKTSMLVNLFVLCFKEFEIEMMKDYFIFSNIVEPVVLDEDSEPNPPKLNFSSVLSLSIYKELKKRSEDDNEKNSSTFWDEKPIFKYLEKKELMLDIEKHDDINSKGKMDRNGECTAFSSLFEFLAEKNFQKRHTNLVVRTKNGSERFNVHKEILIFRSNFFYRMFYFPGKESTDPKEVEIMDLEDDTLEILLELYYTKRITPKLTFCQAMKLLLHLNVYLEDRIYIELVLRKVWPLLKKKDETELVLLLIESGWIISELPNDSQNFFLKRFETLGLKERGIRKSLEYSVKINEMAKEKDRKIEEMEEELTESRKRKRDSTADDEENNRRKKSKM